MVHIHDKKIEIITDDAPFMTFSEFITKNSSWIKEFLVVTLLEKGWSAPCDKKKALVPVLHSRDWKSRALVLARSRLVIPTSTEAYDIQKYFKPGRRPAHKSRNFCTRSTCARYWWSLNTKSDCQLYSQIKEIHTSYSHICTINLAPQLFCLSSHFRDTSPE